MAVAEQRPPNGMDPRIARQIAVGIGQQVASDPDGAHREAQRIFRQAQAEKRLANAHRRKARAAMFKFELFKRGLEALGVIVILEPGPVHRSITNAAQGGTSDTSSEDAARS